MADLTKSLKSDPSKPLCYSCVHRLTIPGDAHSRCNNHEAEVAAAPQGVKSGWFRWPINFDPVWLVSCSGFSDDPKDKTERRELDPMIELLGMLKR
jgi:hypothetical protein